MGGVWGFLHTFRAVCRNLLDLCRTVSSREGVPTTGQRVGYVRVSSGDQHPDRQLEGAGCDRVFTDYASGRDTHRPGLDQCLHYVREGDTLVVHSMDRLARNLDDLRRVVRDLTARGVTVHFVKEGLTFTGDDTPLATLLLSVMGAFAEFERALIRERQAEGIALAKQRGVYRGRPPSLTPELIAAIRHRAAVGEAKTAIARDLGISRSTVYHYLHTDTASRRS
jgi:DNA invertase Pin-like site-specific DNA recombinase